MQQSSFLTAFVVLLAAAACADGGGAGGAPGEQTATAAGESVPRGRPAPDFALETLAGDSLTLAGMGARTEVILMNFWASWCLPCKAEVPDLIALHEDYQARGFAVLGVTVNDLPRDSRAFAEEMEIPYPLVIGTPAMLEDYGISPWLPTTILIADGRIVNEWIGPRTRRVFEYPVKVGLGLAPPLAEVLHTTADSNAGR